MIKFTKERNKTLHVEILKDSTEFKDFYLGFKESVYQSEDKKLVFVAKKEMDVVETMELFATIYQKVKGMKINEVSIDLNDFDTKYYYAIVSSLLLTSYELKKTDYNLDISLLNTDESVDINEYITLANNINIAKELSNAPSNVIYPETFVSEAKDLFKNTNVTIEVFDDKAILDMAMGGLYNVGKGSSKTPRFLVIKHLVNDEKPVCLVGKGVTYDSGGYSIKTGGGMMTMKCDMGGAATVLAVLKTVVDNKLNKNVIGVFPLCENKIDNNAMVPGDIITMYDKTTVEVLNTDAEGRLILADAISYASRDLNAKCILDMATLTGAAANAFGQTITPVVSNDDSLEKALNKAREITEEKFLRVFCYKEHRKMIESTMADIKNIGGRSCGVMTSSVFLEHFANNTPWMHFDIAGTHYTESPNYAFQQKGAVLGACASVYYMVKEL